MYPTVLCFQFNNAVIATTRDNDFYAPNGKGIEIYDLYFQNI